MNRSASLTSALALSLVAASALLGCSSSDSPTTASGASDGGGAVIVKEDGGTGQVNLGSDAAVVCNTITNGATAIPINISADTPPTPMGGTIADGTYYLTSDTYFTTQDAGVTSAELGTIQSTIIISGGVAQVALVASLGENSTATAKISSSGTMLTTADTCPDTDSNTSGYTATGTTVTLIEDNGAATGVEVYTKQ